MKAEVNEGEHELYHDFLRGMKSDTAIGEAYLLAGEE